MDIQFLHGYTASFENSAFFLIPQASYLRITGPDRIAFLQRQTTNDLRLVTPSHSIVTVLTSPSARILDVFRLIQEEHGPDSADTSEAIGVLSLPGRAADTAGYLQKRIFFMDKVSVEEASSAFTQIALEGPAASSVLAQFGIDPTPAMDEIAVLPLSTGVVRVIGQHGLSGNGYCLFAPASAEEGIINLLLTSGSTQLTPEAYHVRRVESGLPAAEAELTSEYTPIETGLEFAVSASKGCYTGQEVIARQITYDKITQRLVGLRLAGEVRAGERLYGEGRPAGHVTSIAHSPRYGWIGLAVVKRPLFEAGTHLRLGEDSSGLTAVVTHLPFS